MSIRSFRALSMFIRCPTLVTPRSTRSSFLDNDIEGSHLPSLQKDDLVDLGVTRVGHRMNIERALKDLMDM
jgi:hypothetical protein